MVGTPRKEAPVKKGMSPIKKLRMKRWARQQAAKQSTALAGALEALSMSG